MSKEDKEQAAIEAAQAKIAKLKQKQRDKEQETAAAAEAVRAFLDVCPVRYIREIDRYLYPQLGGGYSFIKRSALATGISVWSAAFADALTAEMEARGMIHTRVTYSFDPLPADVYNLLDRSGWVQPLEGEPHPVFAWLMQSLGGGKPDNSEHIERVLAYKYLHPECFTLPALVIHGEGGVGKGLLVERVLHTLFDQQVVQATARHIFGAFNSIIKGKTVVMLNEAVASQTDCNAVKALLGSRTITINEKGVPQYKAANTALFVIAANKKGGGGISLDRSNADRRYSILRCDNGQTLGYWVARATGKSVAEATEWVLTEGDRLLGDRTEIGRWIGSLLRKYDGQPAPKALHTADYSRLMDRQKPLAEQVFEAVFTDPDFTHIERSTLYGFYVGLCRHENIRFSVGRNTFYEDLEEWLAANMPEIKTSEVHYRATRLAVGGAREVKKQRRFVLINSTVANIEEIKQTDNRSHYVDVDGMPVVRI